MRLHVNRVHNPSIIIIIIIFFYTPGSKNPQG